MKIRTGHTFSVKEGKNVNSDGNETSSSESAENSIYTTVSARRSTILSCPFNQYSRTPRLAKPVSIPKVPGVKNRAEASEKEDSNLLSVSVDNYADLDFDRILSDSRRASMSTSTTSLAASTMSCSSICEEEKQKLRKSSGSISLTPSMARKIILPNRDDQKDCEYESIYATPTRYMPRHRRHRIRKPTSPPPPPPTTAKTAEISKQDEMNSRDPSPLSSHQMSKSCSIINTGHHRNNNESFKPGTSFDFLYDW